jgi:PKD repeat protein
MSQRPVFSRLIGIGLLGMSHGLGAITLLDANNFRYDVSEHGSLRHGTQQAYADMYRLRVNQVSYQGQISSLSPDGREIRTSDYLMPNSPLRIQRRIYVPKYGQFARYSELIYNDSDQAQTVSVEIFGELGANHPQILRQTGQFLVTQNHSQAPVLMHYHSQVNHPLQASVELQGNQLRWHYRDISIPPRSQRRVVYFVAQLPRLSAADEFAAQLLESPTALFENIGLAVYPELLNFNPALPTPSQHFENAIFLTPDESPRRGELTENDPHSHRRAATPAHFYAFHLNAGETVGIQATAYFDPYLYLFADQAGQTILASNDNAHNNTTAAFLRFTAPQEGTYYLEVTSHHRRQLGEYALSLTRNPANQAPLVHPFSVTPYPLQTPVTATFTDFSRDLEGQIAERCWRFGDGSPWQCTTKNTIEYHYDHPGQFVVSLRVRDDQGELALHSEVVAVAAKPRETDVILPINDRVIGELSPADGVSQTRTSAFADRYLIANPVPGQELVITLRSQQFDSYLYLYDSLMRRIRENNDGGGDFDAQIRYVPTDDRPLFVEATSAQDSVQGRYQLELSQVTDNTPVPMVLEVAVNPNDPQQVTFVGRVPSAFAGQFYTWNVGDGSAPINTRQAIVAHRYHSAGLYEVSLNARNAKGQTINQRRTFLIGGTDQLSIEAKFTVSPQFGERPLRSFFSNQSRSLLSGFGDELRYLWHFGDGEVSTQRNPIHTYQREGSYPVVLEVFSPLTQQSVAVSMPIVAFDRNTPEIPVIGVARERPQVLMAGFDPMLLDVLDTHVRIFAVVRTGTTPIESVRLLANEGDFHLSLSPVATYDNGLQRFEGIYTFARGQWQAATVGDFFGVEKTQFRIQAQDQSGQFHAYPNLETGQYSQGARAAAVLHVEPTRQVALRRALPQVLAAGFDPILLDRQGSQLTVVALVRAGVSPMDSVVLTQVEGDVRVALRQQEVLPNGDIVYRADYTYPAGSLPAGTVSHFFGTNKGQFNLVATDQAGQVHRYPHVVVGNFLLQ